MPDGTPPTVIRPEARTPETVGRGSKRAFRGKREHSRREARWLEQRKVKCESFAEERAIVAKRGHMLSGWSMMRDSSGAEIERHLDTLARPYVERVLHAAWDVDSEGQPRRNWTHWGARAVAVVAWFLAHNAMPTEYHGRHAWRVSGFTMGFFRMLCSVFVLRDGEEERIMPGRSTLGHVSSKRGSPAPPSGWLGGLIRVGLVAAHQFDANKVKPHERGPVKVNPRTGRTEQWAFNQWFLLVCPFEPGETKPKPLAKKKRKRFTVRTAADSLIHRMRREKARKAQERAAQERAEAEQWTHPNYVPEPPVTAPEGAASAAGAAFVADFLRGPGATLSPELREMLSQAPPKPPD